MKKQELQQILAQLKDELAHSHFETLDAEPQLQKLISQIEAALINDEIATNKALHEPLNDAVTRFEGSHPQLTALLNNLSSLLSNMGI